jgi:hypothetical protein
MADSDVDVVLAEDAGSDEVKANGAAGAAPPGDVAQGVEELQRKLDEADRRTAEAERRASEAERRAHTATGSVHDSQLAMLASALDTLDANKGVLESSYAAALGDGAFARAAKINTELAENTAQRMEISRGKATIEAQIETRKTAPPAAAPGSASMVEQFATQLQPRAAAWIRAHPDYVTDRNKNARMLSQHYEIVAAGIEEGSDAYFERIEQGLGMRARAAAATNGADHEEAALSAAAQAAGRRDAVQPPPAPASRGGAGVRTIRLTPAEQEAAKISGLSNEEYAKNLAAERAAGNIGKPRVH